MSSIGDPLSPSGPKRTIKAIDIKTELWHKVIDQLIASGWTCINQYDGMDAGIDYNSYTLQKERDLIKFEWDNWTEGTFACSTDVFTTVERVTGQSFQTE